MEIKIDLSNKNLNLSLRFLKNTPSPSLLALRIAAEKKLILKPGILEKVPCRKNI